MIIPNPSPNFNERPEDEGVTMLIMHYTGMQTSKGALDRMCNPDSNVSAHYMVDEEGKIFSMVPEEKRAWHAGISCWRGRAALNDVSVGIEIVNPGHEFGYKEFPEEQMRSVLQISQDIIERHNIEARNVIGHSDVSPNRKDDPGELFDWRYLAQNGVGLWPELKYIKSSDKVLANPGEQSEGVQKVQSRLQQYGYHIKDDGYYGPKMEYVVKAFKRHFVQDSVNVVWDKKSNKTLKSLIELIS